MAHDALRKSTRVVLTVAAAMGMTARGQQGADPCQSSTFSGQACQLAIRHQGYCSGAAWVPMTYSQPYPYYYDSYSAFVSGGGLAVAGPSGNCRHPGFFAAHGWARGGFGGTGSGRHAGS
jgi:hypothetical protein